MSAPILIPKRGTLERAFLEKLVDKPEGVTYVDFEGTGITEQNIDQIANNLRTGMFESDQDESIGFDS